MSAPGWYPDPTGRPGHKFWDGARWHDAVPEPARPSGMSGGAKALAWMLTLAALTGVVLIGKAIQDERVSARDDRYIALLAKWAAREGDTIGDRATLIAAGHYACNLLRSGSGPIDATKEVMDKYGLSSDDGGPFVAVVAEEVLCPQS